MDDAKKLMGYDSLAFFGNVNASISHELKNIMAIISETAGLLEDLSALATMDKPVEPAMLKNCTQSIGEEIQRAFDTIRQMNRFAHSVDAPKATVNLMDVLDLVGRLLGYKHFSRKIDLLPCSDGQPMVFTCPFLLQTILYQVLAAAAKNSDSEATIGIAVALHSDSAWRVTFSGCLADSLERFPDAALENLAASIGVVIHKEDSACRLSLDIPLRI